MDDPKILVALIAAASALIVSLVTLWQSSRSAKINAQYAEKMERLKYQLEFSKEELVTRRASLRGAMESIQQAKDVILLVIKADGEAMEASEATDRLKAAAGELIDAYTAHHAKLKDGESRRFHQAKNLVADMEKYASDLPMLAEIRNELSECQNVLRDSLNELIADIAIPTLER